MNTKKTHLTTTLTLGAFILLASACTPADDSSTDTTEPAASTLLLSEAPTGALSVSDARKQAQPGQAIQVSGQIGGTLKPFVDGYAAFVLADPELVFCDEMGDDDHCSTPWDACCEDSDKLQSMRVSVQFVDGEGNPIQEDLKSSIGLKELDNVAISGTVAESSTATNVIIHATGLYKL